MNSDKNNNSETVLLLYFPWLGLCTVKIRLYVHIASGAPGANMYTGLKNRATGCVLLSVPPQPHSAP